MRRRDAFTVMELIVVVGVIMVLAGLAFAVYMHAKAKGGQATCANNLRELGQTLLMYAQDNGGYLPPYKNAVWHRNWIERIGDAYPAPDLLWASISPYVKTRAICYCPNDPIAGKPVTRWAYVYHLYSSYYYNLRRDPPVRDDGRLEFANTWLDAGSFRLLFDPNSFYRHPSPANTDNPEEEPGCEHFGSQNVVYLDGHAGTISD